MKAPERIDQAGPEAAFSPQRTAREVLATAAAASLGTIGEGGTPFVSLVTVATGVDGTPILLLSALAQHSRNLAIDPRASLLLVGPGGEAADPLAGARLTVCGRAAPTDEASLRRRFLARNPSAAAYAGFGDFSFYRFETSSAHLVAGFGRIVALAPGDLFPDYSGLAEVVDGEDGILAHLNANHGEALSLYATQLLGEMPGTWQATGADPDGLDLALNGRRARLWYRKRAENLGSVRTLLREMAEEARQA